MEEEYYFLTTLAVPCCCANEEHGVHSTHVLFDKMTWTEAEKLLDIPCYSSVGNLSKRKTKLVYQLKSFISLHDAQRALKEAQAERSKPHG